jgi:hypothetical protein
MSWVKQNENLYNHSEAPFCIVKQSSNWVLIDTRDQSKAIPIDDIFNNPIFSINFENQVVLASHFRGEGLNTPATPAHSFKTEISSGLYRESAGVLAISSLGTKVLTINTIPSYLCKAWVSFDGSVTSPISSGSGNISSIIKNGTGDYTINFATPMQDANYSIYMSSKQNEANLGSFGYPLTKLAGSLRFIFTNNEIPTPANRDQSEVSLGIFR